MKRWSVVFRTLSNVNRLKIISILSRKGRMNVGDIAQELSISFAATSNHLAMLKNLDVLEADGSAGHVFYFVNRRMPKDFRKILSIVTKLQVS